MLVFYLFYIFFIFTSILFSSPFLTHVLFSLIILYQKGDLDEMVLEFTLSCSAPDAFECSRGSVSPQFTASTVFNC